MLEDVAGDVGFVDARVLVRLEVLQGILGDAFMLRKICHLSVTILRARGRGQGSSHLCWAASWGWSRGEGAT